MVRSKVLTDRERNVHEADFDSRGTAGRTGWEVKRTTLRGGLSEGVDTVEIDNGKLRFIVVPTRYGAVESLAGRSRNRLALAGQRPGASAVRAAHRSKWFGLAGRF